MSELGQDTKLEERKLLGMDRTQRFRAYGWLAAVVLVGSAIWMVAHLKPHRWYKYTDVVSFEQVAHDVEVGFVLWEKAQPVKAGLLPEDVVSEPAISSDGTRMVYARLGKDGTEDLFLRRWDGSAWGKPRPMRALNSNFQESSPSLSGDGTFLYFSSNRPGGLGGYDIWVAKWDGAEYAWPLPLTSRVNTPFDELGPAISPDHFELFFSSNRPRKRVDGAEEQLSIRQVEELKVDHDLYSADLAQERPYDLMVERRLSMLYSLREGALASTNVMGKLGGTPATESAVDKALAFLASTQSEDGRWDLSEHKGAGNHDMAATGAALLVFYGRGERHDLNCTYQETVRKGIDWLVEQQGKADGDLRGVSPKGDMYDHGIAGLALVEAYGVTKDQKLRPRAQSAVDFIEASQNKTTGGWRYKAYSDGGFDSQKGDLSVSGWIIMVLASAEMSGLKVKPETIEGARKFLKIMSGGKHGGSFGYAHGENVPPKGKSPAMNAVGFFCSQLLGLSNNSELAAEASEIVDQQGLSVADLYYSYYGTLASYQQQGPAWRRWLDAMREKLVAAQAEDGSWAASGAHGGAMGTVVATALAALSLEAHYRYTPLYGLGFEPDPAGPMSEAEGLKTGGQLPSTPLFRHAQHIPGLSSSGEDLDPVVTEHGDFIYFASSRSEGQGGMDIYRARFKRPGGADLGGRLLPGEAENLGPEINSASDETAPALRMAGFNLMFNSARDKNSDALYGAMSRRVERRYDYSKMPTGAWMADNIQMILALAGALMVLVGSTWYAIRDPKPNSAQPTEERQEVGENA
ncbi:MAG: hypothetical protein CMO74_03470 [Verrucomicrobiales bacterium]|nr:hypothetical protein [Verrucomicrobiales bacterium]|tara:strand:- start:22695 stop:25103 length:2409 start_codon:yes stop_codon:yes gene_type:complete